MKIGTLCFQKYLLTNNLVFVIWLCFKESVDPLLSCYAYPHLNTRKFQLVIVFGSVERVINLFQILTEKGEKRFSIWVVRNPSPSLSKWRQHRRFRSKKDNSQHIRCENHWSKSIWRLIVLIVKDRLRRTGCWFLILLLDKHHLEYKMFTDYFIWRVLKRITFSSTIRVWHLEDLKPTK